MARKTLIDTTEDMEWLRDVHVPHLSKNYKSAIIYGNEDSPSRIEVYVRRTPLVTDEPLVFEADEDGVLHPVPMSWMGFGASGATKRASRNIEDDTPILPWILAERAIGNTPGIDALSFEAQRTYADWLSDEANRLYKVNPDFAKQVRAKGNRGRDQLYAFMQHWFAAMLKREHPEIWRAVERSAPGYGWSKIY